VYSQKEHAFMSARQKLEEEKKIVQWWKEYFEWAKNNPQALREHFQEVFEHAHLSTELEIQMEEEDKQTRDRNAYFQNLADVQAAVIETAALIKTTRIMRDHGLETLALLETGTPVQEKHHNTLRLLDNMLMMHQMMPMFEVNEEMLTIQTTAEKLRKLIQEKSVPGSPAVPSQP
jgi:hypothetical protein